jgi:preprotein translocase subunit SecF
MEFFKKRTNIRFMPLRMRWYAISGVLIVASLLMIGIRGLNLGIDFTGGVVLELSFPQAADLDKVRGALATAGHEDATVQSFGTERDVLVRLLPKAGENTAAVG